MNGTCSMRPFRSLYPIILSGDQGLAGFPGRFRRDSVSLISKMRVWAMRHNPPASLIFLLYFLISCSGPEYAWKELEVTVTAYNSVPWQTSGNPSLTAWGDTLRPGMQCITVSRDLIALGLDHNTEVKIQGLPGTFLVKDKMNRRFKRHIDLYMGEDVKGAREWGRKKRVIRYRVPARENLRKEVNTE